MNLVLTRNVGRRCIQTLPNCRSPTKSRRVSRQISPSQKSRGILTPSLYQVHQALETSERITLSAPTYRYLFIINGISESVALLECLRVEQSLFQEKRERRSIMYLRLVVVILGIAVAVGR